MSARSIGTPPGAAKFRSTLVIIIVLICIVFFFHATGKISQQVEQVAVDGVVTEMRQAVATMLYDYAVKGRLRELSSLDLENPFVPLAIYRELPRTYHGVVDDPAAIVEPGWYFDRVKRTAIYRFTGRHRPDQGIVMQFVFDDLNGDAVYSPGDIGYLKIESARPES